MRLGLPPEELLDGELVLILEFQSEGNVIILGDTCAKGTEVSDEV